MVGFAVKVTLTPAQIVIADAFTLTLTGKLGLTVIVTVFDVAGLPVAQVAFDVNTTKIISPFASAVFVYVALFVPTLLPFNFH